MSRYPITKNNTTLHLYYPSIEAAKQAYPNANIEPYVDDSFIKYIKKIMVLAEDVSATWWKIPYGCGYIAYRQFKDGDGWLDGGEYMRYDKHSYTQSILKTLTNPQSFYERFFEGVDDGEHGFARFTKRQFDKLKGKAKTVKFCSIDGTTWYVDNYGNFFARDNYSTSKKAVDEWKQLHDNPDATANANLSARLPYIFAVSRFAHYLKCIVRDKIGSFKEREDMQNWLSNWINNYVTSDPNASEEVKAKYPLAEARVEVEDIEGQPGYYNAKFYMRPHYQLEGLTTSLRLVSKLPSGQK